MGKLVGTLSGKWYANQDWQMSSRNRVYHLYKSVPFTEKWLRKPETGIKDGFEEIKKEFPFGS